MVRMSALRNRPVVCGNKRLGLLQSVSLDSAQKRVRALIVSCGVFGKRVVPGQDVLAIADGFILASGVQHYRRVFETPPCAFVRDTTGLLTGRVTDYAIDEETLAVAAVELTTGYLRPARSARLWALDYVRQGEQSPELTVPACLGRELINVGEGT